MFVEWLLDASLVFDVLVPIGAQALVDSSYVKEISWLNSVVPSDASWLFSGG